jgi:hypothetical protein
MLIVQATAVLRVDPIDGLSQYVQGFFFFYFFCAVHATIDIVVLYTIAFAAA